MKKTTDKQLQAAYYRGWVDCEAVANAIFGGHLPGEMVRWTRRGFLKQLAAYRGVGKLKRSQVVRLALRERGLVGDPVD